MKKSRFLQFFCFYIVFSIFLYISSLMARRGSPSSSDEDDEICGGIVNYSVTDEIKSLGRFSVDEHNKKENAVLEFVRVVKAKSQVVSGVAFYITLEVMEAGEKKIYEARVWLQEWLNFKELTGFYPVTESSASTPSNTPRA